MACRYINCTAESITGTFCYLHRYQCEIDGCNGDSTPGFNTWCKHQEFIADKDVFFVCICCSSTIYGRDFRHKIFLPTCPDVTNLILQFANYDIKPDINSRCYGCKCIVDECTLQVTCGKYACENHGDIGACAIKNCRQRPTLASSNGTIVSYRISRDKIRYVTQILCGYHKCFVEYPEIGRMCNRPSHIFGGACLQHDKSYGFSGLV